MRAHAQLKRAEENETFAAGLYWAHVCTAEKRIATLTAELKQYEEEHPEL